MRDRIKDKFQNSAKPIKLFWWDAQKNFGDGLGPLIVQHISGREVTWASHGECELFSVGSILRKARQGFNQPKEWRPAVWGAGMIGPHRVDFVENVDFFSVRGPITASLLGVDIRTFGDPGLLAPHLIEEPIPKTDTVGVIPHHGQIGSPRVSRTLGALQSIDNIKVIDVRVSDPMDVVRQIASCRYVFSESLHGLIVADAFGIPNTWIQDEKIHVSPSFKFLDYFLSVGRQYEAPIRLEDIQHYVKTVHYVKEIDYLDRIEEVKASIISSFPSHLICQ